MVRLIDFTYLLQFFIGLHIGTIFKSPTASSIVNNINPLNLSWKLNNTEQLITSTQNLELNTSEQGIIVIESNYSSSGIYPLTFKINSSALNDNATGVSVS